MTRYEKLSGKIHALLNAAQRCEGMRAVYKKMAYELQEKQQDLTVEEASKCVT